MIKSLILRISDFPLSPLAQIFSRSILMLITLRAWRIRRCNFFCKVLINISVGVTFTLDYLAYENGWKLFSFILSEFQKCTHKTSICFISFCIHKLYTACVRHYLHRTILCMWRQTTHPDKRYKRLALHGNMNTSCAHQTIYLTGLIATIIKTAKSVFW